MNLIRKIVIGQNPKDAMAYYVGMRVGQMKVDSILLDERHLAKHSIKRYLVYLKGEEGLMLWKTVENVPCLIEYDLNF